MSYSDLLKKLIKEANVSYKDIVEGCVKYGTSIDKSYISKLVNNVIASPSQELLQTLEKVLNAEANILVVEAYFDNAPEPIKEFSINLRERLIESKVASSTNTNDIQKEILAQNYYNLPMIKILEFFKSSENLGLSHFIDVDNIKENEGVDITITNDALAPLITSGTKIHVVNFSSYNEGDLVSAITDKNGTIITGRFYTISKNEVMLIGTNLDYDPVIANKKYFKIIGKVVSYNTKI